MNVNANMPVNTPNYNSPAIKKENEAKQNTGEEKKAYTDENINYKFVDSIEVAQNLNKLTKTANKTVYIDQKYDIEKPYIQPEYFNAIVRDAIGNTLKEQINETEIFDKAMNKKQEIIDEAKENLKNEEENLNKALDKIKDKVDNINTKIQEQRKNDEELKKANISEKYPEGRIPPAKKDASGVYIYDKISKDLQNEINIIKKEEKETIKFSEDLDVARKQVEEEQKKIDKEDKEFYFRAPNLSQTMFNEIEIASSNKTELIQAARKGLIQAYQDLKNSSDIDFPDYMFKTSTMLLEKIDKLIVENGENIIDEKA